MNDAKISRPRFLRGILGLGLLLLVGLLRADEPKQIHVAIYDDASGGGPTYCERCLPADQGFVAIRVTAAEIRGGALDKVRVLIQPGGSGSAQAKELEKEGRDAIHRFVENGGGYLGICAGAYLASADYDWSLGLLNAKVIDRKHWARGKGDVEIRLEPAGQKFLDESREIVTIRYAQGPLLAPAGKPEIPAYEQFAAFETEMVKNGAPEGVMKGTTAVARAEFGRGRVFCFSPHPEQTDGLDHYVSAAVRWLAEEREPAKTSSRVEPAPPSPSEFLAQVDKHFADWDLDGNDELSVQEIDAAVANLQVRGEAAAAIAAIKRASRQMRDSQPHWTLSAIRELTSTKSTSLPTGLPAMYVGGLKRISKADRELFPSGGPRLETVHQGRLGDCFCLAALGAVLDKEPQRVTHMFIPQTDGACRVVLGSREVNVSALTDAELALTAGNEHGGCWINVYEKAVGAARVLEKDADQRTGSPIDALARGGSAGTMLSYITGHKIQRFSCKFAHDEKRTAEERAEIMTRLQDFLRKATEEHRPLTCGTDKTSTPGLTPNHAYAVIKYDAEADRLTLWNPHGDSFAPKGPAGLQNGYSQRNGVFTVPLSEFVQQFSGLAVETLEPVDKQTELPRLP